MSLNNKMLIFFGAIIGALMLVINVLSFYSFRQFSLYTAERHALSVAETVREGLTESMINGTISRRPQFLNRLRSVPGVQGVHVVRGPAMIEQFGRGLSGESPVSDIEKRVLVEGKPHFEIITEDGEIVYRSIVPYIATAQGTPNCLSCHKVSEGTVLGAVSVDIPLGEARHQAIVTMVLVNVSMLIAALLSLLLLRRLMAPLVDTANALHQVVTQALSGSFSGRIVQHTSDEVGAISGDMNRFMAYLEKELRSVSTQVSELMGQPLGTAGNQLVATTEMVENLVAVAKFKQAIEEDQNKQDIYRRLAEVLKNKYDYDQFSIYEVSPSKNRITPTVVDGEGGAPCRWCDAEILVDAGACRARRTGHEVNAVDFPGICTMFRDEAGGNNTHLCLPISQSGIVGCVVQIVVPVEQGQLAKLMLPFVAVYLREAAPVLEAKRLMEHLRESSLRDAMTGLYNRRFLEEYVATLVAAAMRKKTPFSVLMLDLDHFKQVNDTFGHEAGDRVLKVLAEILAKSIRNSDLLIRYGGEEFLIILLETGPDAALHVAENIRSRVAETKIPLPASLLQKTISIGVAEFPTDADNFWQVVKFADVALYEAKKQGRNRVVRFLPEMWSDPENC